MTEAFPGHMPKSSDAVSTQPGEPLPSSSARFGAFTDAVVAIAMTLLILPLTEAIPEASTKHLGTVVFLHEHQLQLLSFALSFVLIGMFWLLHHRIFRADTPHSFAMSAVNFGWMFTIVFLPVPTAMVGALDPDRPQFALYIGTMLVSSLLLLWLCALQLRARRKAELITPNQTILATPLALCILYAVALAAAMLFPHVGYFSLVVMWLTWPLRLLLVRFVHD